MARAKKESFHTQLVLNRWLLSFFHGGSIAALQERMRDPLLESLESPDGQSGFYLELTNKHLFHMDRIPEADLRRYDLNIIRHWKAITERRNQLEDTVMRLKYFQYLSLLCTEIYLDWFFNRPDQLLEALNKELEQFNFGRDPKEHFVPYRLSDLNKVAFWNATGSGKTLLLHVNIFQYREYFKARYGNSKQITKTILLTPSEGLSRQHLMELELSGFSAKLFEKDHLPERNRIDIIDINKLGDTMGDKVVAVEAFEGNNLVLVDEGHRGTGKEAGAWLARREALCADGFSFEYSATFGQAVSKSQTILQAELKAQKDKTKKLTGSTRGKLESLTKGEAEAVRSTAVREQYAKCILFDYSYKFFYEDGYGKESLILNLADDRDDITRQHYLTACLLSFYQQQWLWREHHRRLQEFNIERPLWIFVGNKVNDDDSDVLEVIRFLGRFINDKDETCRAIRELNQDESRLLDAKGRNIFHQRFLPISHISEEALYNDILKTLFNSESKQRLKVVHLKGGPGELALRLGEHEPFGVINIGDAPKFAKLCDDEAEFDLETDEFGDSLFEDINKANSEVHLLIGSRKFSEGWSSWRVSTMGLMNMGRGEGSQIIQLFGRGVRLKGKDYSLQRSRPGDRPKGVHLELLETLNIFGIRADYMAQFKDYLKEEGITPTDEMLEVEFATKRHNGNGRLKTLSLKDGYKDNQKKGFKRSVNPELYVIPDHLKDKIKLPHTTLDLYPRIQAMRSGKNTSWDNQGLDRKQGAFCPDHFAFMDFDRIYRAIVDFKAQRSWFNLRLDKQRLTAFCQQTDPAWYTLYIPPEELEFHSFADVRKWEDILVQLLHEYTIAFYRRLKGAYEEQFVEVATVKDDDDNYIRLYHFDIEDNDNGNVYYERLKELADLVDAGDVPAIAGWNPPHMVAICFDRHLYYPLMHIENDKQVPLKMRPLAFDAPSEVQFVRDLEAFYNSTKGKEYFANRDLYLMRNSSHKSKGIGFALAGNFYPDFMLWIIEGEKQYLAFIDPKGLRQVDRSSPKMQLYKEIKSYEKKLNDPNLVLESFVLSETKYPDLLNNNLTREELADHHILFMDEGYDTYLAKMLTKITG